VALGIPGGWAPWQPNEIAGLAFAGLLVWTVMSAPKVCTARRGAQLRAAGCVVATRTQ
jgi:hypothetical protein